VLLATARPRGYSAAALRARIAEEPFRSALANTWRAVDINGVLAHFLATDKVARAFAAGRGVEINTDDRNVVEFGLARSVGRSGSFLVAEIRALARAMGASRPPLDTDAGIAWPAVQTAWANFVEWDAQTGGMRAESSEEGPRQEALRRYYQTGDVTAARDSWGQRSEPPRDPSELAMAADLEAEVGSDGALPLIEQLRHYQPAEADIILATLRLRQSRIDDAAAALESALVRLREDPWPTRRFKEKALTLAEVLSGRDSGVSRRLFVALRQPFSLRALDETRLVTLTNLSRRSDFVGTCREPIGALEPHVPWTAGFLSIRRDCYLATADSRLSAATRDLDDYVAHEPLPLAPR
jgi:hypothetical protein